MSKDFTFIHAADIHLDSPLNGLAQKDAAFSQLVRGATRRAFSNVVDLAIEEGAAFVVIAGDLYDGSWKDQSTGQFALSQLARLTRAGIRAVIAFGNHDAESRISKHFTPTEGIYKLNNAKCETVSFDDLGVAVHGRSYKEAHTFENIASTYKPPVQGLFNLAILHTALEGHPSHAPYAPCTVGELQAAGHDYWALGHVHEHAIRSQQPWIVYPGNTQGRNVRETGAKGAVVVKVEEGEVRSVEHRACDEVRWAHAAVDAMGARHTADVLAEIQSKLREALTNVGDRPTAARLTITANGQLARQLASDPGWFDAEVRSHSQAVADNIWVERIRVEDSGDEAGPSGLPAEIAELLAGAGDDPDCLAAIAEAVAPLMSKLPAEILTLDGDASPLLSAAKSKDHEALLQAALAAVETRIVGGKD
jgi:exonuclease SbcD